MFDCQPPVGVCATAGLPCSVTACHQGAGAWLVQHCDFNFGFHCWTSQTVPHIVGSSNMALEAQIWSVPSSASSEAMGSWTCGFHSVLKAVRRTSPAFDGRRQLESQDKPHATASPGLKSPGQPCIAGLLHGVPLPGLSSSAMR